jgi:anti-sigma regulatory factor (Ser/Thr protein kinase)
VDVLRSATEWFRIDSDSAVGSVRRAGIRLANTLGFPEQRAAEVGIVASEIASNVRRHGERGGVALRTVLRSESAGVEIIGIDRGPGMADVRVSSRDGHSTRGTLGVGLGAIQRLSTSFDVSSHPGVGTVVVAMLWSDKGVRTHDALDVAALTRPLDGEEVCGDAVAARQLDGHLVATVADGLGHGPMAAAASTEAVRVFHETASSDPAVLLRAMHDRLTHTRGAAIAVASIDPEFQRMRFAGVGNIGAFLDDGEQRRSALSQPGITGHRMGQPRIVDFRLTERTVIVMHSDGIREGFNLGTLPGLVTRPAAVIAATVLRDAGSRPDDAAVLVARRRR